MTERKQQEQERPRQAWGRRNETRGFCGVGIYHGKTVANLGTLWRTAHIMGADFLFTIGDRYRKQASDTTKAWRSLPLWQFDTFEQFHAQAPHDAQLVGVELDDRAGMLGDFIHPPRAIYLLGAEDHGLPPNVIEKCARLVRLPGEMSMNVAVAGSIVLYDRSAKTERAWAGAV